MSETREPMKPEEWIAARILDDQDATPLCGERAVAYVTRCIRDADPEAGFYGVLVDVGGRTLDVCHTGNGPRSRAHAEFIAQLARRNAALEARVKELEGELAKLRELQVAIDSNGHYCDGMSAAWTDAQFAIQRASRAEAELAKLRGEREQYRPLLEAAMRRCGVNGCHWESPCPECQAADAFLGREEGQ